MTILLLNFDVLGELILSEPMIRALRNKHPGCEIHAVLSRDLGAFALSCGLVDKLISGPPYTAKLTFFLTSRPVVTSGAMVAIGSGTLADPVNPVSASRALAADPSTMDFVPVISVPALPDAKGFVAIHPTAEPGKAWPLKSWETLCKRFIDQGSHLLIVSGPQDLDWGSRLVKELPKESILACINQPLTKVAGLIAGCSSLTGGETGISHLSAALGVKTIATWDLAYGHYHPIKNFKSMPITSTVDEMLAAHQTF